MLEEGYTRPVDSIFADEHTISLSVPDEQQPIANKSSIDGVEILLTV